ncbi:MAG TPA: 2OG-Fe(II) oxygenase [Micromonosporaceae bacterium]|nr:2OG-Fe(II) oxygenase [Micromonosporaceae bacterium]
MFDTNVKLERFDEPYLYYVGDGLLSTQDLARLNDTLPNRALYQREIKRGSQHRKEYNMWRCEPAVHSTRTPVAGRLPDAWAQLVDGALSAEFRSWLSEGTQVDLSPCPVTVGLYVFEDGDFTTIDTGKMAKAQSFGIYLNRHWSPQYGGAFQVFTRKDPDIAPFREIVPIGGRCITMAPSESSWHRIQTVDTGGEVERLLMMVEFWRA